MSQPRPVTTHGHPYGKPSSWVVVAVAITAFVAGAVGLILQWWWLFFVMAGVFVVCVPAGAAAGIMGDTVGWATPLDPRKRPVLDAAQSTQPVQPAGDGTSNASEPDVPDEFGQHPEEASWSGGGYRRNAREGGVASNFTIGRSTRFSRGAGDGADAG